VYHFCRASTGGNHVIGKTLYDFNSNKPDEISFTSGEELVGDLDVAKPHIPFKIFILSIACINCTYSLIGMLLLFRNFELLYNFKS